VAASGHDSSVVDHGVIFYCDITVQRAEKAFTEAIVCENKIIFRVLTLSLMHYYYHSCIRNTANFRIKLCEISLLTNLMVATNVTRPGFTADSDVCDLSRQFDAHFFRSHGRNAQIVGCQESFLRYVVCGA